ncbi:voltage-gated potassium channel [Alteromonadaceae bacterium Bs31]|nr:voltage-gated potassium channel [Alteromonadaceae bacterium Bs31]
MDNTENKEKIGLVGTLDWIIAALIIVSVIGFSVETLPHLRPTTRNILKGIEAFTVLVFICEYIYRIYRAKRKLSFIFSFYGIIDLLAILPYLIAPALDLRSLRLLRFLRFIRLLKLARYNQAIYKFGRALVYAKEEIIISFIGTSVLIFLAAIGIYHFEHAAQPEVFRSVFDALWWAFATFTTVGYGDVYPITTGGRLFTMGVLVLGLGLVAGTTGIFASALMKVSGEPK